MKAEFADNYTLRGFLALLASASGDTAIELISLFQSGAITVEGLSVDDFA